MSDGRFTNRTLLRQLPENTVLIGRVRKDTKLEGRLDVGYQVRRHLTVVAGADVTKRTTNFPDYVPGVFPAGAQYDVRWDYVNWEASAGVRLER